MARSWWTPTSGLKLEAQLRGEGDDFLLQVQEHLERDIEEVAAAAGGVHDDELAELS